MFYFYTNSLGFDAEFMGRVRLLGSLASLAGVAGYNFLLKVCPRLPNLSRYPKLFLMKILSEEFPLVLAECFSSALGSLHGFAALRDGRLRRRRHSWRTSNPSVLRSCGVYPSMKCTMTTAHTCDACLVMPLEFPAAAGRSAAEDVPVDGAAGRGPGPHPAGPDHRWVPAACHVPSV